jgi:hypothetical protein
MINSLISRQPTDQTTSNVTLSMVSTVLPRKALKTRITLAMLLICLLGMWSLSFYATHMLRKDMERLLGEQQFTTLAYVASEINGQLDARIKALEQAADPIDAGLLDNPAALQQFMDRLFVLHTLFNDGVMAYRLDGTAIATTPLAPERRSSARQ